MRKTKSGGKRAKKAAKKKDGPARAKAKKRWKTGEGGGELSDAESRAIDDQNAEAAGGKPRAKKEKTPKERDPRLPAVGETILRTYKDEELKVDVLEDGFRFKGETYSSLSKLAAVITKSKAINGFAFFKLLPPKAKSA